MPAAAGKQIQGKYLQEELAPARRGPRRVHLAPRQCSLLCMKEVL